MKISNRTFALLATIAITATSAIVVAESAMKPSTATAGHDQGCLPQIAQADFGGFAPPCPSESTHESTANSTSTDAIDAGHAR